MFVGRRRGRQDRGKVLKDCRSCDVWGGWWPRCWRHRAESWEGLSPWREGRKGKVSWVIRSMTTRKQRLASPENLWKHTSTENTQRRPQQKSKLDNKLNNLYNYDIQDVFSISCVWFASRQTALWYQTGQLMNSEHCPNTCPFIQGITFITAGEIK